MSACRVATATVCAFAACGAPLAAHDDPSGLRAVLDRHYRSYRGLELKYEGQMIFPDKVGVGGNTVGLDGVRVKFSGMCRIDAATPRYFLDVILDYPHRGVIYRRTTRVENDVAQDYHRDEDHSGAKLEDYAARYNTLDFHQSFFVIYPIYSMTRLLEEADITVEHAGQETVDGRECEVYRIHRHKGLRVDTGKTTYWCLWLDFARGAIPLKREFYGPNGEVMMRVRDVKVREVGQSGGVVVWLPVEGYLDTFGPDQERPGNTIRVYALTQSVRVDPDLGDDAFAIKLHPAMQRSEAVAAAKPISDQEADARLQSYLGDMGKQGNGVEASAYSRTGNPLRPYYWALASAGGVGLIAAGWLAIRRAAR